MDTLQLDTHHIHTVTSELVASGKPFVPVPVRLLSGPNRHSTLIFMEYEDRIRREVGIDVFERQAQMEADHAAIRRLLQKYREDGTYADESLLDQVEQDLLRAEGVLTEEEQQTKNEFNLAKARNAKDELRESGMSDASRFGFCKRSGCANRKVERLLVRGFCPDCRGLKIQQTIAGGGRFDVTTPLFVDATAKEMKTSIKVFANRKKAHPDVWKPTTQERREKVLAAKENNPAASIRDIAALTGIARTTVHDILKSASADATAQ